MQNEKETLEDSLERLSFNLKRSRQTRLKNKAIKLCFLRGIHDDCMDVLNLIGGVDVSKLRFNVMCAIYKNYSRSTQFLRSYPRKHNSSSGATSITKCDLGMLLDDLKIDIF